MNDQVECHSGYTYAQRPTALYWQNERLIIEEILSEWHSPHARSFKVITAHHRVFELSYLEDSDQWRIIPLFGDE
jgi:hypothetical protein